MVTLEPLVPLVELNDRNRGVAVTLLAVLPSAVVSFEVIMLIQWSVLAEGAEVGLVIPASGLKVSLWPAAQVNASTLESDGRVSPMVRMTTVSPLAVQASFGTSAAEQVLMAGSMIGLEDPPVDWTVVRMMVFLLIVVGTP
jgi:hypothetical protein